MRSLSFVVALIAAVVSTGSARAPPYPARPITLIVPFAAGGAVDITARIVGEHMSGTVGQQVVIENVVGAGGTIASARAMRVNPDGYTVMLGHLGTHAFVVALYPNLPYKPDVDFQPIGQVATNPLLIAARRDFPASDLKEFIAFVKANEGKRNVSHAGVGSVFFTTCLLVNALLEVNPTVLPFSGGAQAMNALLGAQVDYTCPDLFNAVAPVRTGAITEFVFESEEHHAFF